ncbi:MAG: Fur family transcriptional regulator [Patescibacteria group bacterium]
MIEKVIKALKNSGYRITPIRRALFEILITSKKPISVDGLIRSLAKKGMKPNKTTIYRELASLKTGGFIKEVQFKSDCRMYEITSLGHHHHLVCTKCNTIEDVRMENDMKQYEKKIYKKMAFKIFEHSLEFFGLCRKCQ